MKEREYINDCTRGCSTERVSTGELLCEYQQSCCKRGTFSWLKGAVYNDKNNYYEVRFKNTRKAFFKNASGQLLSIGDIVVVEATSGHDVGIITLDGAMCSKQIQKLGIKAETYEFRKIYRKAKPLDIERWQEAIALEHNTMIRSRQISQELGLDMKIGDIEYQGDGTKAIFYYIADKRVDFRQLIKVFAEKFAIRIEMKQIGVRQEAGLIGGLGICGRALCCSNHISTFHSITTASARCQELSLNPQKLAGQCGKLKCCINYEAPVYIDAQSKFPHFNGPLELKDGQAYLIKKDILRGLLYFSYDQYSMSNMIALTPSKVKEILKMNRQNQKPDTILKNEPKVEQKQDFISSVGDDNIDRFSKKNKPNKNKKRRNDNSKNKSDNNKNRNDNNKNRNEREKQNR